MADYDNLTVGQLVETSAHINGWQKLRRLMMGGVLLHTLADGAELGPVTGTYTGDGAATKDVTFSGGRTPRVLLIFGHTDGPGFSLIAIKTNQQTTKSLASWNQYEDDHIISMGAGTFRVGDGTGSTNGNTMNINATDYTYIIF